MDEIDFLFNSKRLRLSRRQVLDKLRTEQPEPLRTWGVEVEGRMFPVKQAFAVATGCGRADFISTRARDLLRKLGFRVFDVPEPESAKDHAAVSEASIDVRRAALEAAIQFFNGRPDATADEVVAAAASYEKYLTGAAKEG
jgi:hypothetical protein